MSVCVCVCVCVCLCLLVYFLTIELEMSLKILASDHERLENIATKAHKKGALLSEEEMAVSGALPDLMN